MAISISMYKLSWELHIQRGASLLGYLFVLMKKRKHYEENRKGPRLTANDNMRISIDGSEYPRPWIPNFI